MPSQHHFDTELPRNKPWYTFRKASLELLQHTAGTWVKDKECCFLFLTLSKAHPKGKGGNEAECQAELCLSSLQK